MTIQQMFSQALSLAIKNDLRGEKAIKEKLAKIKAKYLKLTKEEKAEFDQDNLTNPYPDSKLFTDQLSKKVKKILIGIDIETAEIMLAHELKVDAVISHHPMGAALAGLDEVMHMQVELLAQEGIPINVAQHLMQIRISEVNRSVGRLNYNQGLDAAKLLNIPVMCMHTFCDNLVTKYLDDLIKKNKKELETVGDIMDLLKTIPEYQIATKQKAGPKIFVGNRESYAGRIAILEMTGGTNGSKEIYEKMAQAGVGTIIGMHMAEEWKKEAEKSHVNVIVAGHMSSDSLGLNILMDVFEKQGVDIIPCSGFTRVSRNEKKK